MKMLAITLMLLGFPMLGMAQAAKPCGKKLYVAPMNAQMDQYIKADIVKQKLPFVLVNDQADADLVMDGVFTPRRVTMNPTKGASWTGSAIHGSAKLTDKSGATVWMTQVATKWAGVVWKHHSKKAARLIVKNFENYLPLLTCGTSTLAATN